MGCWEENSGALQGAPRGYQRVPGGYLGSVKINLRVYQGVSGGLKCASSGLRVVLGEFHRGSQGRFRCNPLGFQRCSRWTRGCFRRTHECSSGSQMHFKAYLQASGAFQGGTCRFQGFQWSSR